MQYADLFGWWAAVITAGIIFITLVSIYLYVNSTGKAHRKVGFLTKIYRVGTDFIFIWILLSLLSLYIISIGRVSAILFALGNIAVEIALVVYVKKNVLRQE